jgi:hypothetical protein
MGMLAAGVEDDFRFIDTSSKAVSKDQSKKFCLLFANWKTAKKFPEPF